MYRDMVDANIGPFLCRGVPAHSQVITGRWDTVHGEDVRILYRCDVTLGAHLSDSLQHPPRAPRAVHAPAELSRWTCRWGRRSGGREGRGGSTGLRRIGLRGARTTAAMLVGAGLLAAQTGRCMAACCAALVHACMSLSRFRESLGCHLPFWSSKSSDSKRSRIIFEKSIEVVRSRPGVASVWCSGLV